MADNGDIYLRCANCGSSFLRDVFDGKMADRGKKVYCSISCSQSKTPEQSIYSGKTGEKEFGPCPTCGRMFFSKRVKKFCSIGCFLKNPEQRERLIQQNKTRIVFKDGGVKIKKTCPQCGKEWEEKPSRKSKFCGSKCYRLFMAKRFDRWIANPQKISLPQNYDEFMVQNTLPCLVEGCTWRGQHLSNHMNFWHGVKAEDLKRAAGFNLSTGLVALPTHDILAARPHIHEYDGSFDGVDRKDLMKYRTGYVSLEGREHYRKSLSLRPNEDIISVIICEGCGVKFEKKGLSFNQRFCSPNCRSNYYYHNKYLKSGVRLICCFCHNEFSPSYSQMLAARKGKDVVCSNRCRGKRNSAKPRTRSKNAENNKNESHGAAL